MWPDTNIPQQRESLSLSTLNARVRQAVSGAFPEGCWLQAEMSDVRINSSSGHCYLEFIEKHPTSGQLVAKARGTIWANTFRRLKAAFEAETRQAFTSGLKVLVRVTVDFHELYGFNLTVQDIDPAYTLGDMVRRRMEIIRRLQEEGVFELNKGLSLPDLPRRIAVVTSPTAAGYEDFLNQLVHNKAGFPFYVKLFPAIMQGEKTEASVIAALDRIYPHRELFDAVVIIRGGGATSDLNCFDAYLLAANCAQFPLPILTGIGHERDDTVTDMVAHTRLKTPTAVAEFLIARLEQAAIELQTLQQQTVWKATDILGRHQSFLQLTGSRLPALVLSRIERSRTALQSLAGRLPLTARDTLARRSTALDALQNRLATVTVSRMEEQKRFLDLTEQYIRLSSPEAILKRGYSLTLADGRIVKHAAGLQPGQALTTRFADGEVHSTVTAVNLTEEQS